MRMVFAGRSSRNGLRGIECEGFSEYHGRPYPADCEKVSPLREDLILPTSQLYRFLDSALGRKYLETIAQQKSN